MDYYFTYGTAESYPFQGGWTRVTAPSLKDAIKAFRRAHPDRTPNILNCADYYVEAQMSDMLKTGNRGAFEHEHIIV